MEDSPPTTPRSNGNENNNPQPLKGENGHYDVWNDDDVISFFGYLPRGGKTCDLDQNNIISRRTRGENIGNKYIPIG